MKTEDRAVFTVETAAYDDHVELRLSGELDIGTAGRLREAFQLADGAGTVVVDMSALEFIDSTGLHELVVAHERRRANGSDVVLRAPTAPVRRVLELVGLDQLFTIQLKRQP